VLNEITANAQLFLLIFVRVLALIETAPLLSSDGVPQIAKIALAFFAAFVVIPWVRQAGYPMPPTGIEYALLVAGEALVGILIGFYLVLIYAGFQLAGQYLALDMGFGASEVFDPLAQIEIPVMGQFLNLIAMFIFITIGGFQKLFLVGVFRSFQAFKAADLVLHKDAIVRMLVGGLADLFAQSLIISLPILGTLFLVSVSMGLMAKAAPQMNLLMMGFPISIGVAFIMLFLTLPFLAEAMSRVIDYSFEQLLQLFSAARRAPR
jgi:flagellar biosynthetic protein FliR